MLHRSSCSLSWTQGSMRRALCILSLKLKFTWIQKKFSFSVMSSQIIRVILYGPFFPKKTLKYFLVSGFQLIFIAINIVMDTIEARERYNFRPQAFPKILKQEYVEAALVFLPQPSAWLLTQRATFVPDMCPA